MINENATYNNNNDMNQNSSKVFPLPKLIYNNNITQDLIVNNI